MEYLLAGTVLGAGYLLNSNNSNEQENNIDNIEVEPTQSDIYSSDHYKVTKLKESNIANERFNKSKNAIDTNIIPPQFNNRIINTQNNSVKYLQYPNKITQNKNNKVISSLSGKPINFEEFTHNNMSPFFGSSVKQNTYELANQPLLELYTGTSNLCSEKDAIKPMFNPHKSNTNGTQINTSEVYNRFVPSNIKNNEKPIDSVLVGPGLNKGYTNVPSGGFGQNDTRDFMLPKTTNELRVLTNPKMSYSGRINAGKSTIVNRRKCGKIEKYRPDTYSKWDKDRLFTTTGAFTKEKNKSCLVVKDTNRKVTKSYTGSGAPATRKKENCRSNVKISTKNNYLTSGPRNMNIENKNTSDYGKNAINLATNERDITGTRTHTSNLTAIVKAIIAPVEDIFRTTRKENVIGNVRQTGNFATTKNNKQYVYDPNDIAKTTIKETTIHDNSTGHLTAPNKLTSYDPNDVARTTIKETNIHNNRTGNMINNNKITVYDPNDIAKVTIKETNIHNSRHGNMESRDRGYTYDPNDLARTTIKETNIHDNRQGNLDTRDRGYTYDPNDVARTTIKETNIHDNRQGNLDTRDKGYTYDPTDLARTTIKETNIHDNRQGNLDARDKGYTYDPNDVAKTTIKETNIHDNRQGNLESRDRGYTYDPDDLARTTIKETNIHDNRQGNLESRDKGYTYDPNDIARTTIKETNIHDIRTGNMENRATRGFVIDPETGKARITNRNTLESEETVLNINLPDKGYTYDPNDIARTTIKETNIHDNRQGNMGNKDIGYVYDPNDLAKTTIKETNIDNTRSGNINNLQGNEGGYLTNPKQIINTNREFTTTEYVGAMDGDVSSSGLGYLTNEKEAPNTNRQFSTKEYTGTADSNNSNPMSYSDYYNATLNEIREGTLEGRQPTLSNVSLGVGKNMINQETKKIEGDQINSRELNTTKIYNSINYIDPCSVTTSKQVIDNEKIVDRIEPSTLDAFNNNPYTKPLDSYVFN
tara:strand:+ start:10047 stop:13007 length:2961 start_codon:yes stop_codon:yes gene_type:complete